MLQSLLGTDLRSPGAVAQAASRNARKRKAEQVVYDELEEQQNDVDLTEARSGEELQEVDEEAPGEGDDDFNDAGSRNDYDNFDDSHDGLTEDDEDEAVAKSTTNRVNTRAYCAARAPATADPPVVRANGAARVACSAVSSISSATSPKRPPANLKGWGQVRLEGLPTPELHRIMKTHRLITRLPERQQGR